MRGFAVLIMLVALLAASALFSVPAGHHHPGAGTSATSALLSVPGKHHHPGAGTSATCVDRLQSDEAAHDHRHGNDWTPRLSQRGRAVIVAAVPYPRCALVLPTPTSTAPGVVLSRLGVLRV
ncbi:hypothetical protein Aph02nite_27020 [Actinoplanes philippinensis]|uniref:Secreted protein n=1 Tax=Actinoplanes philippinensis TaxID=35752 RepID=A0A1I2GC39_9ACTN|nr:hypothetical protein Aph02nite_27020 [Actinoplanes philippinensis]SFF14241.1 hypothetical protein SAMN05421541_106358 [Actinoplanes philippinensis]